MKLLLCADCWDVFKLAVGKMRKCSCGKVKGRYLDNLTAEVSENAISLAIGNGSLATAISSMLYLKTKTKDKATRDDYIRHARIEYAWVRPNSGDGNPHTKLIKPKK